MGHVIGKCLLAIVPVVTAIGLAACTDLIAEPGTHLVCRVLPNGMVPVFTGRSAGCNLRAYDRVIEFRTPDGTRYARMDDLSKALEFADAHRPGVAVEALVIRRGDERWVRVPVMQDTKGQIVGRFFAAVVVAAVVMGVSLMILWGSSEAAAAPFAYFYACVSVVLVSVLSGRYSDLLVVPSVAASGMVPATLAHIALTFPREREVVDRAPHVLGLMYGFSFLLALIAVVNLNRSPVVWALADRVILVLALATWAVLVIGSALALRESKSILERTRARILLAATAVVPAASLAVGLSFSSVMPGGSLSLMTITVAILPLPIGYAISHYRLFDLGLDLKRAISYILYVAASAAVIAGVVVGAALVLHKPLPVGDPVVLFAIAFAGFLVADPLRARLRGAIDSWMAPGTDRMTRASEDHAGRAAELGEPEDCARLLCRTVGEGVEADGISVFLMDDGEWRLAHAQGEAAVLQSDAAKWAAKIAAAPSIIYLAEQESLRDRAHVELRARGVDVVAPLDSGHARLGLVLIGRCRRGSAYTTPQLRFIETVISQSAVAIHNANLARSLAISERLATQGRLGTGLIHDLGKPLGVMEHLAKRLPERLEDGRRVERDALTIADLAAQMRAMLRDFLEVTQRAVAAGPGSATEVDTLLDLAVRSAERTHGRERVSVRLAPDLPSMRQGGEAVVRAVACLLDNAFLASGPDDVVEVAAAIDGDQLVISVIDHGSGMSNDVLSRAFEPFFTTRPVGQGSGVGLAICRDLINGLGGTVELKSTSGVGTRARVRVPIAGTGPSHG